jgi:hypothetical protein
MCRRGRRGWRRVIRAKAKGARRRAKALLCEGRYDEMPQAVNIGYTD